MARFGVRQSALWGLLAAACSRGGSTEGHHALPAASQNAAQEVLARGLSEAGVPGLAAARIDGDRRVIVSVAGLRDARSREPVTPYTRFQLASVGKLVVALSVRQLAEQGRIALDEPLPKLVPALARAPRMTPLQLLTHTAGIVDPPNMQNFECTSSCEDQLAARVDDVLSRPSVLGNEPGPFRYSNVGYALLATLVERASGERFDRYTQTHVFVPLGMRRATWFAEGLDPVAAHHAPGHPFRVVQPKRHALYPAVDLYGTATDAAQLLLGMSALDGGAPTLRGAQRVSLPPRELLGHEGEDEGASVFAFVDERTGRGAVLLGNGPAFAQSAHLEAFRALFLSLL
jgi:CubicO group peptidase (beta-lactamase class C family)